MVLYSDKGGNGESVADADVLVAAGTVGVAEDPPEEEHLVDDARKGRI